MGREIRRVPAGWEHPKESNWDYQSAAFREDYKPLHDTDAQSAWEDWQKGFAEWCAGGHAKEMKENPGDFTGQPYTDFCAWDGGPPDVDLYRPRWNEADQTHFQMYETVSEGTPVSPVFATAEELADYLVAHGDFRDQNRGTGGWSREAADAFCKSGYAPSMMVSHTAAGVEIIEPRDAGMYAKS